MPTTLLTAQTPLQIKIDSLLESPLRTFNLIFSTWRNDFGKIWNDSNPPAVVAGLGNKAVELFTLSSQLAAFLESNVAGCTAPILAKMADYTVTPHGDGTITVVKNS